MVVVAHDPDLVGGLAEIGVVLCRVGLAASRHGRLRKDRDGEDLAVCMQRAGQVGDQPGEGLLVASVQFLVVDVNTGIVVLLHQRHDRVDVLAHQRRVVQDLALLPGNPRRRR